MCGGVAVLVDHFGFLFCRGVARGIIVVDGMFCGANEMRLETKKVPSKAPFLIGKSRDLLLPSQALLPAP